MYSSYAQNNFAEVFKAIVSAFQPKRCVEIGTLEGYSAIAIGQGLKENFEKSGSEGHLDAHDLFEEYKYRNASIATAQKNIDDAGVGRFVTLHQQHADTVAQEYGDGSIDLLHIDISNDGNTIRWAMEAFDRKMVYGGIILFEGGTDERDQVEWMLKYTRAPIKKELETNPIIAEKYVFATYTKFPAVTCLLKKR